MTYYLDIKNRSLFAFPESFMDVISATPEVDIEPWWFIVFEDGNVDYWYHALKKLYPKRDLVPFAKFNANDDIACFDGNDNCHNPQVFIIHTFASEGWELHNTYKNFNTWFRHAIDEHAAWSSEE
ncbi:hypothetical protein [Pseudomonas sp. B11(2017)]|uniref:hypothetical protein n=1 Tax=Pseudomonas sp. B11(2017) TaxID=1981748 RepID=UPI000A1E7670|nr:hypothetical protein [Pseudomonas sp. B11(2017)]